MARAGRGEAREWPGRLADRVRFERGARRLHPGLRAGPTRGTNRGGFRYVATIDVPYYQPREITIVFPPASSNPVVLADGPTDSLHRYDDGALCMWHPGDPASMRWCFDHGLLDLLDAVRNHLFREAWWREHGEWLGPEVSHLPSIDRPDLEEPT